MDCICERESTLQLRGNEAWAYVRGHLGEPLVGKPHGKRIYRCQATGVVWLPTDETQAPSKFRIRRAKFKL
jgi:hypothetical protein